MKRYSAVTARAGGNRDRSADDRLVGEGPLGLAPAGVVDVHLLGGPLVADARTDVRHDARPDAVEVIQHIHHRAVLLFVAARVGGVDLNVAAARKVDRIVAVVPIVALDLGAESVTEPPPKAHDAGSAHIRVEAAVVGAVDRAAEFDRLDRLVQHDVHTCPAGDIQAGDRLRLRGQWQGQHGGRQKRTANLHVRSLLTVMRRRDGTPTSAAADWRRCPSSICCTLPLYSIQNERPDRGFRLPVAHRPQ